MDIKVKQYGGALFSVICKCGQECEMPNDLSVNDFVNQGMKDVKKTIPAVCRNCGQVEQPFVGWLVD